VSIVLLVIDGLGARSVRRSVMPTLARWADLGLWRPEGATAVMCASTYPNFASIVTGSLPAEHGMYANVVVSDGVARSAAEVGPRVPTLLDAGSEVVVGDQNLIGVMSAETAGRHWPPLGGIPPGIGLDDFGYVSDVEVTARVLEALERGPDLLFAQLNGPDTVAHIYGPDSEEATQCHRELDRCLARIDESLDPAEDLLLVTSDHDQETVDPSRRIDLAAHAEANGAEVTVVHEGTAAMVVGPDASKSNWVEGVPGVQGRERALGDPCLVFSEPGWWFAGPGFPDFRGAHGGPRTRATVAIAVGAQASLRAMDAGFFGPRLGAEDWFGLVRSARSRS
jgi:predicted AlkP superfamily pyrophosphatase or phosphodiesterase